MLRRKLAACRGPAEEDGWPGADRSWRLALARAARDEARLVLDVEEMALARVGLAEALERIPERALIAVLQGPEESLGILFLSPEVLASVVENQTIGRVNAGAPAARKPTRTDAAMAAGMIDAALMDLEVSLAEEADRAWAGGYRYASHLEEARPLGLILEDCDYRVMTARVALASGARRGEVALVLPAEGRGGIVVPEATEAESAAHNDFAGDLAERVEGAHCALRATLARVPMPLGQVTALAEGMVLPLAQASIERIRLEGLDGRILGEGRLGQNRGLRAVRLAERGEVPAGRPAMPGAPVPEVVEGLGESAMNDPMMADPLMGDVPALEVDLPEGLALAVPEDDPGAFDSLGVAV